jgi:Kef-type K+ transport system membrane component KefB
MKSDWKQIFAFAVGTDTFADTKETTLSNHPVLWVMVAAVAAPLLAEIPVGFRLPVVVLEVVLGILIGPHALGLVRIDEFLVRMRTIGMAASLFMAGMEIDFKRIRGRPLSLAVRGWGLSLALGLAAAGLLSALPLVHAPIMITLALTTTALGTLLPVLRDAGQLDTPFGRLFLAAGTVGEVGPIVAISLALSKEYSEWQEIALLLAFLTVVFLAAAVGLGVRPPKVLTLLRRTMSSSTQLPVRVALLILAAFFVMAEEFGLENILGAFAAGMVVGLATRGEGASRCARRSTPSSLAGSCPFSSWALA